MANKTSASSRSNVFASMVSQLHSQSAQQAQMQKELQTIKHKLEQASKTLMQKDQIIGSLELDLEHMIDQLVKFNYNHVQSTQKNNWHSCSLPVLNQEINSHVTA